MLMRSAHHSHKAEMLSRVPLFGACTRDELARIESITDEVDVEEGRVLVREGRVGGEFFVVVSGTAAATRGDQPLATFGPGAFFGEMALLDGRPRSATVVAQTPMRLLVLEPRSFARLIDETPTVARRMLTTLAERIRSLDETWL